MLFAIFMIELQQLFSLFIKLSIKEDKGKKIKSLEYILKTFNIDFILPSITDNHF